MLHISDVCLAHFCLFKVKLFSIWPHGYSKDVRAPSQIYKWVSHNEYDDTKQKYSSVSSGNAHNLIYSILLWQMHYRNVLCSNGLLNHLLVKLSLWAKKYIFKVMLLWYVAFHERTIEDLFHFCPRVTEETSCVFTWMPTSYKDLTANLLRATVPPWDKINW